MANKEKKEDLKIIKKATETKKKMGAKLLSIKIK
jgi:hypothetical protein